MPPLSLEHQEQELNLAISVARWFKLLAMRMPVDEWAALALREYKRITRSTKAPAGDMASLLAQLEQTVGKWFNGQGKDLVESFHKLLSDASVSNANFGGQNALQRLGLMGSFNLTNPAVLANLQSTTMYTTKLLDMSTNNLIGQALVTGAAAGLDMDKTGRLVQKMVGEHWTDLSHGRARSIATTEVCRATSWASRETYYKNGLGEMEWYTAQDERVCPACGDMHGQRISTSGTHAFQSKLPPRGKGGKGVTAPYPPAHPTCRCTLLPVIPDHWTKPVKPWTGGKHGGPADAWSGKIQDVIAERLMRTSGCKVVNTGTSLDSKEIWESEPQHANAAAYHGWDGQIHIGPEMSANLRTLLEQPWLGENLFDRRLTTALKGLVHENIHGFNPIAQRDYAIKTGAAMEEGLTESLALKLWQEVAEKGFGMDYRGATAEVWGSYPREVQTVNLLSMAASATGKLSDLDYLVRWKTGMDPALRWRAIGTDVLKGMGYSDAEIKAGLGDALSTVMYETILGKATLDDLATWIGERWHTALEQ